MKLIDEDLLAAFRSKRRCELCAQPADGPLDPHHVMAKGMGGASRVDVRENLLALCRECHCNVHAGNIHRDVCWLIVALREGLTVDECRARVMRVLNAPKGTEL